MGRGNETFGKKDVRNKQAKKRKEKAERRQAKKEQGKTSLDDMIAYVDENGMLMDTPPEVDPKKKEIDPSTIVIGTPKKEDRDEPTVLQGRVKHYDQEKGYGFISDPKSRDSIFFHRSDCDFEIRQDMKVEYDIEKGPRGLKAVNIKAV